MNSISGQHFPAQRLSKAVSTIPTLGPAVVRNNKSARFSRKITLESKYEQQKTRKNAGTSLALGRDRNRNSDSSAVSSLHWRRNSLRTSSRISKGSKAYWPTHRGLTRRRKERDRPCPEHGRGRRETGQKTVASLARRLIRACVNKVDAIASLSSSAASETKAQFASSLANGYLRLQNQATSGEAGCNALDQRRLRTVRLILERELSFARRRRP